MKVLALADREQKYRAVARKHVNVALVPERAIVQLTTDRDGGAYVEILAGKRPGGGAIDEKAKLSQWGRPCRHLTGQWWSLFISYDEMVEGDLR